MLISGSSTTAVWLALTQAIGRTRTVQDIYTAALDALRDSLGVSRAAVLLFDASGVMRFVAARGLSESYRHAVEGHSPWSPDVRDPRPLVVPDVTREPSLAEYLPGILAEGLAAMTFIPIVSAGRTIGKFMLYYETPHETGPDALRMAEVIGSQVAFAVERIRAEEAATASERRLRFALDAARMGTWDWNLASNHVRWSENLERLHNVPAGTFDGSFASYEREIHPDDRERVLASARRAIAEGTPHDVEYRIVAPDGSMQWVEGKGHVEYEDGRPVRMTGVCMIVTRRKEAELARLSAAQEASRLKDEFLATLSHELRTPLNAVLGWVQMLQADDLSRERVKRAVDIIGRNARLQAQLIEDMLDVSGIVTGKLHIDRMPIVMPQMLETAIAAVQPQADAKQIAISKAIADDLPPIEGDPRRLQQVLGNLLSNAIKFTGSGGQIKVRCHVAGSYVAIEVADSGIGIERDFLPYVFDRFRQADSRTTRRHGGLGLGLAIARHIVEQHGGHIAVRSEGHGYGSTFEVRLPAELLLPASPSAADSVRPSIELRLDNCTVLVVDDAQDARDLLCELFATCGARVTPCGSASAALEALASAPASLIVADIAMPDMDGLELIGRIRRTRADIPAVAVSACPEDRDRALAAGFNGYCSKPVDAVELLRTIRGVLAWL